MSFKLICLAFSLLISSASFAHHPPHPCKTGASGGTIDLYNSDDLFFAGRLLTRNGRTKEGIECLNRGKVIAPSYLDIRLELMNAFQIIRDKDSGLKEAADMQKFKLNPYYAETWNIYYKKIQRITHPARPLEGFKYINVPVLDLGHDFKKIDDIKIIHENFLRKSVELKNEGNFDRALDMMERHVLPFNRNSATVFMYAGIFYASVNDFERAESYFAKTITLVPQDVDVVLLLMRAISANNLPHTSLNLATEKKKIFVDYGCFKLGSNLVDIYTRMDSHLSVSLQRYLTKSLTERTSEAVVCRVIKTHYL